MGKRFAILIGAAALGAALMAVGASADFRSVHDRRGDTRCVQEHSHQPCSDRNKRDADIVRATAGHDGTRLRHTIRVVGKFQGGALYINTDSDGGCEWVLYIAHERAGHSEFRKCDDTGVRTGRRARIDFHRHSVEIFFRSRSIGNPRGYGWRADAQAGGLPHASDRVLNVYPRWIRHRLAQPAAAASSGVVKYDTKLTLTKDRGGLYHGWVMSDRDRNPGYDPAKKVRKCMEGRRVILFERQPGPDRKLGTARSDFRPDYGKGVWGVTLDHAIHGNRVRAKVERKVRDRFVCRADRSAFGHAA